MNKICIKCHESLPLDAFYLGNHSWICKKCCINKYKEYQEKNKLYWESNDPYKNRKPIVCRKCYIKKSATKFGLSRESKEGINSTCKKCENKLAKENRLRYKDYIYKYNRSNRTRHKFSEIQKRNIKNNRGPLPYTVDEFIAWHDRQPKECEYCGISAELLSSNLWGNFSKGYLHIDRKDSNIGYLLDNICLACTVCNCVKNNFFDHDSFKELAKIYIMPRWKKLFKII